MVLKETYIAIRNTRPSSTDRSIKNTFSKFIADKFSADLDRKNTGSILTFDKAQFIDSYDGLYNHRAVESGNGVKIDVQLIISSLRNSNIFGYIKALTCCLIFQGIFEYIIPCRKRILLGNR